MSVRAITRSSTFVARTGIGGVPNWGLRAMEATMMEDSGSDQAIDRD
jgi:hypothetical protein